jgi:hypothetical protein
MPPKFRPSPTHWNHRLNDFSALSRQLRSMIYLLTVLTLTVIGDASRAQPTHLLALLPRGPIEPLPICQQIVAKAMNDSSHAADPRFTFDCLKISLDLDPKTLLQLPSTTNPAPFIPAEKPTLAVAHMVGPGGKEFPRDVLLIFRLSDFLSESFAMGLCQNLIATMTEIHYSCEPYAAQ